MHQPLTIAHEERVRLVNGEIIHLLRSLLELDGLNLASFAFGIADVIPNLQVFRFDPAFAFHVERMLGRGFEFFAVNDEVDDGFIRVVDGVCDGIETDRVRFFIPREDVVPDLDLADGLVAFNGGDFRVRAEAVEAAGGEALSHIIPVACGVGYVFGVNSTKRGRVHCINI